MWYSVEPSGSVFISSPFGSFISPSTRVKWKRGRSASAGSAPGAGAGGLGQGPPLVPMSMTVEPSPPVACSVSKWPLWMQQRLPLGTGPVASHCFATLAETSAAAWHCGSMRQLATHSSTDATMFLALRSGRLTQQQSELLWIVTAAWAAPASASAASI